MSSVREQNVKIMSRAIFFKSLDINIVSGWDRSGMTFIVVCTSFNSASKLTVKIPKNIINEMK